MNTTPNAHMHWHANALGTLLINLFLYNYYQNIWLISYIPYFLGFE
jgi:hypothetical protein